MRIGMCQWCTKLIKSAKTMAKFRKKHDENEKFRKIQENQDTLPFALNSVGEEAENRAAWQWRESSSPSQCTKPNSFFINKSAWEQSVLQNVNSQQNKFQRWIPLEYRHFNSLLALLSFAVFWCGIDRNNNPSNYFVGENPPNFNSAPFDSRF